MRLRRIEIAQFRKLTGPVVLDGLGDGLIVVSGDNEEGKSTVLAALKAAFFEHHAVRRRGPRGHGAASWRRARDHGRVRVCGCAAIACARRSGARASCWRCKANGCRTTLPSGACRSCCGSSDVRRAAARPENAGLQALFWVDQATAFRDFETIAGGRDRLAAAIGAEIGSVAGGERSRHLLALARERAAAFYTAGRQQETGALKAASERLRALEAEHGALAVRRREFDARVDRLARQRDDRRRLIEQDQAARAGERRDSARRRLAELAELERRSALAIEAMKAAAAEQARVEAQHRSRHDLIAEAARLGVARP